MELRYPVIAWIALIVTCDPIPLSPTPSNVLEIVAAEALLLPEESLADDVELVQTVKVQEGNGSVLENRTFTTYEHPLTRKLVVRRWGQNDTGLPLVVVGESGSSGESWDLMGRTFVVLRQSSSSGGNKYRAFYAYFRDTAVQTQDNKSKNHFVEFEGWEERSRSWSGSRSYSSSLALARALGWSMCFQSVLPPCKTDVPKDQSKKEEDDNDTGESGESTAEAETTQSNETGRMLQGISGPEYFDLFVDLEEPPERLSYLRKVVAIYVYTLSAATGAASNQALNLAGIRPPVAQKGQALDQLTSTKLADMKRAIALFKQTINESDLSVMEDLFPGDAEIAENAAIVLLPSNTGDGDDDDRPQSLPRLQIQAPQGGLIKGGLVGLLLGPNGLVNSAVIRGSDPGKAGDDGGSEFHGKAIAQDDDLLGTILKYALNGGRGQTILGSVAGAVLGADGNGGLIESMVGSLLTTPGGSGGMVNRATSLLSSLVGGGGVELALERAEDAADSLGFRTLVKKAVAIMQDTDLSLAYPAVDAFASHPPFRHAVEKALQSALKRIPHLGLPLAIITDFFQRALKRGESSGAWGIYSAEPQVETSLFVNIGWRTADINPEELAEQGLFAEGDKPFIGFGNCPQKSLSLLNYQALSPAESSSNATLDVNIETVAELWAAMFRNQCSDRHKIQLAKLQEKENKLLTVERGVGSLTLNLTHPLITKRKLLKSELIQLSAAFEVSTLSQVIISNWGKPRPQPQQGQETPPSTSRTISTLVQSILVGVTRANRDLPTHFIKLVRNAATTLKTAFTKLLQDFDRYKACTGCGRPLLEMAKRDLLEVVGLLHYLLRGMGQIDIGSGDVESNYKSFFMENKQHFEAIVKTFE